MAKRQRAGSDQREAAQVALAGRLQAEQLSQRERQHDAFDYRHYPDDRAELADEKRVAGP